MWRLRVRLGSCSAADCRQHSPSTAEVRTCRNGNVRHLSTLSPLQRSEWSAVIVWQQWPVAAQDSGMRHWTAPPLTTSQHSRHRARARQVMTLAVTDTSRLCDMQHAEQSLSQRRADGDERSVGGRRACGLCGAAVGTGGEERRGEERSQLVPFNHVVLVCWIHFR